MAEKEILLSLKGISKQYPGVLALDRIDLDIRRGEVHALAGENGAGKSTLIKILAGAIRPDEGYVEFEGKRYEIFTPVLSRNLGISVVYQEFNLMDSLTVMENVFAGHIPSRYGLVDYGKLERETQKILQQMNAPLSPRDLVMNLSTAHIQLVEIAKSLSRPVKLMILDEPTAPLTTSEVHTLFDIVRRLKQEGVTIIFITHRLDEIYEICDRITILRDGKKILTEEVAKIDKNALIHHMVGRELSNSYPARENPIGEVILEVKGLSGNGVHDVSFQLHKGEILGLAGLVGAGRTEIMRVLYGADPADGGEVYLRGKKIRITSPKAAVRSGIVLLPEDRKKQGVMLRLPISQNIVLTNLKKISSAGVLDRDKERRIVREQIDALHIACHSTDQIVATLSGGNQQKVVLAKWLVADADVLIFDEPTRGIDVGAKYEIYLLMNRLCQEGKSIIMISSEMEELMGMADRTVVMYEGNQMGILEKGEFSSQTILKLASGEKREIAQ